MTVTMISSVTLDGVVQAPGLPDEDTRDGVHSRRLGSALRRRGRDRRLGRGHSQGHRRRRVPARPPDLPQLH